MTKNKAGYGVELLRESLEQHELIEAAIQAEGLLKVLTSRAAISAPLAVEVRATQQRLFRALFEHATRPVPLQDRSAWLNNPRAAVKK